MGFEPTIFGVTGQYVNRYTTGPQATGPCRPSDSSVCCPNFVVNRLPAASQDDCKVFSNPFMASLSNHRQLEQASFDKLRMSRHQWAALLCNRPVPPALLYRAAFGDW